MPGTHYTLDREKAPLPKEKPCKRCGVVKLNDFAHFGKKWFGDRKTFTTVDICLTCKAAKMAETFRQKFAAQQEYNKLRIAQESDNVQTILKSGLNSNKP